MPQASETFRRAVAQIGRRTHSRHVDILLERASQNLPFLRRTIRDLPALSSEKAASGVVISAGPSLRRRDSIGRIRRSGYKGTIIAVDAAYVACLREGLIPDFVVTLDPHPTRLVRWFGDPDLEANLEGDDYFERQDLDVAFRNDAKKTNQDNIALVDRFAKDTKAIVASSAPQNVTRRLHSAKFDVYWWNPLVDDPAKPESLTRRLYELNGLPSLNTGGNVGSAAWVFAATKLRIPRLALTGMDLGYYPETPYKMTQTYHELVELNRGSTEGLEALFANFLYPSDGQPYYTDPTYFWYRRNFLQLLTLNSGRTYNCTEGGTLFSDRLSCVSLDEFIQGNCDG